MLGAIYKLWPASGFPLAGLVLVVPGNLVMPSVDSSQCGQCPWWQRPWWGQRPQWWRQVWRRLALLALELQVGGKAHRIDAVLFNRFLVTGGEFGVVFIAGARGVVNVL